MKNLLPTTFSMFAMLLSAAPSVRADDRSQAIDAVMFREHRAAIFVVSRFGEHEAPLFANHQE